MRGGLMRYDAVIFDLDGTLLETERLVIDAGLIAFGRLGLPARRDVLEAMVGHSGPAGERLLRAAFGPDFDLAAFEDAWSEGFAAVLAQGIPLRPGVTQLLDHLDAIAMPRAVATNSQTDHARDNLATAGIGGYFQPQHILGRDRVARPKPAPDLFLHAARVLGADPARCLVFEDSDPGTIAAHAAGMVVVQVPDQRPAGTLLAHVLADSLLDGARRAGLMT
jgi:HAD superfamily hydrolase (TIGR01509 family)